MAISIRAAATANRAARRLAQQKRRPGTWSGRPEVAIGVGEALTVQRSSRLTWVTSIVGFAVVGRHARVRHQPHPPARIAVGVRMLG